MAKTVEEILHESLDVGDEVKSLDSVVLGIVSALASLGISVDRLQIPFTQIQGYRHPLYWGTVLTYTSESAQVESNHIFHSNRPIGNDVPVTPALYLKIEEASRRLGPYVEVIKSDQRFFRTELPSESHYEILGQLENQGYREYCAFGLDLPSLHLMQFVSIASKRPFPEHLFSIIDAQRLLFALTLYAAYRTSQAITLAQTYVGRGAGNRVLNGEIARDFTQVKELGIMFADIRNFTKMSEELGPEAIVRTMNQVFEAIEKGIQPFNGEILKFIGDAVLVVFSTDQGTRETVCHDMAKAVRACLSELKVLELSDVASIKAGFGVHFGTVTYGNIGTNTRLDFTVMGPNVNLTSRVESLTKSLGVEALFTEEVAQYVPDLVPLGPHALKGVAVPTHVWTLPE